MLALKADGFDGNYDGGVQDARLWCDATAAIAVGDWIGGYPTDTSNPGAIDGETYKLADSDNIGSGYGTVGVAMEALASGTGFIRVRISGRCTANVTDGASVANGDPLCIGATAGRAVEQILDASTTANRRTIGICRSTPSSNQATVDVIRHPKFGG